MNKSIFVALLIFHILFSTAVYAEDTIEDNTPIESISAFNQNWTISVFSNYHMGVFTQSDDSRYMTSNPWSVGLGIRYKKFSISASYAIPIQGMASNFDFEMATYATRFYFVAYLKYYQNFFGIQNYFERDDKPGGLNVLSAGLRMTFVQNYLNHSLGSVVKLDKKQNISSGSFLYGFGLFLSSLDSSTEMINISNNKQNLLYTGFGIGYSYIWVLKGGFFINGSFVFLLNSGINLSTKKWLNLPQLEPNIVIGYHHSSIWSINLKIMNRTTFILWDLASGLKPDEGQYSLLSFTSIGLMFAVRF
jgi:hypothetical protein